MKKAFVLIAAIVAVVGIGAAVAVAKETIEVPTSVTLHVTGGGGQAPGDPHRLFSGKVTAKKGCQKGRTVVLVGYGYTSPVGQDESNARGKFKIVEQLRRSRLGTYPYRVVVKRKITKNSGDKIVCKTGKAILHGVPDPFL